MDKKNGVTLFAYTDGSAIPNPGITGWGIHIAVGSEDGKPKTLLGKYRLVRDGYVSTTVFKNSDKLKNEELAFEYGIDIYGTSDLSETNNQAELDAITKLLDFIPDIESTIDKDIDKIIILTDSSYSLIFLEKVLNDSLDMENVKANKEHIERLDESISLLKSKYNVEARKIKAHNDDLGNERADMLANMGRILKVKNTGRDFNVVIGDKDFWKDPNIDKDVFNFKQLFNFYPDGVNTDRSYYGLNYKKESEIGKKISSVSYTIMKLGEQHEIVNDIIKLVRSELGTLFVPYVIRLQDLLNKDVVRDYLKFGTDFIIPNKDSGHLIINTITGVEVARELYPPALSTIVKDRMSELEFELLDYQKRQLNDIEYIDITNLIFEQDAKDKTIIKKELVNDKPVIKYKYGKVTIKLKMKYDLPPRNTLKRFEKKNPKVLLVIKDLGNVLEYKTITILDNKDFILTSNIYSNKIIFKKN